MYRASRDGKRAQKIRAHRSEGRLDRHVRAHRGGGRLDERAEGQVPNDMPFTANAGPTYSSDNLPFTAHNQIDALS